MEAFVVELSPEEEMLRGIIEPLLDSEGFELVRLSLRRSLSRSHLAIFVDTKDKPNGIVMGNLEFISRFLSDVLDSASEDKTSIRGSYELEVSSPGLDRPMTKASHFANAIEQRLKIRLKNREAGSARNLVGRLVNVDIAGISLDLGPHTEALSIKYGDIAEAHLVFDFDKPGVKKKN